MIHPPFINREQAGRDLARALLDYKREHPLVLALPRGGVVLGYEVAKELNAPLEVLISRKIGAPHNPEFGVGAISENDTLLLDTDTISVLGIEEKDLYATITQEKEELERRIAVYRQGNPLPSLEGKTVIIVDDGLATGVTARAAIEAVSQENILQVVFAAPVCNAEVAEGIQTKVDQVVCLHTPLEMRAIGLYYQDFEQVSDAEVMRLLDKAKGFGGVTFIAQ